LSRPKPMSLWGRNKPSFYYCNKYCTTAHCTIAEHIAVFCPDWASGILWDLQVLRTLLLEDTLYILFFNLQNLVFLHYFNWKDAAFFCNVATSQLSHVDTFKINTRAWLMGGLPKVSWVCGIFHWHISLVSTMENPSATTQNSDTSVVELVSTRGFHSAIWKSLWRYSSWERMNKKEFGIFCTEITTDRHG
jgi:hypothetical protein